MQGEVKRTKSGTDQLKMLVEKSNQAWFDFNLFNLG
jgi:hypothetical protein